MWGELFRHLHVRGVSLIFGFYCHYKPCYPKHYQLMPHCELSFTHTPHTACMYLAYFNGLFLDLNKRRGASDVHRAAQKRVQLIMGGQFFAMGVLTLLCPSQVINIGTNPSLVQNTAGTRFVTRCFGSQATLQGVLLLTCDFKKRTWLWWGAAIVPFLIFNVLCSPLGPFPALSWLGVLGDGFGNIFFLGCCVFGYLKSKLAERNGIRDLDD